jgi:hypothetical protein
MDEGNVRARPGRELCGQVLATGHEGNNVCACAVFSGTHSGVGGAVPPTGKSTSSDYVYVMEFEDGRMPHD